MWKILGAIMIIFGCGSFAFGICAASRKEEAALRQLISALDFMQCELQFRLTPLPDLCAMVGREQKGVIGQFFGELALELENQVSPDVISCVRAAGAKMEQLPTRVTKALDILGTSLGRFDTEGQIVGLEQVRFYCREEVERLSLNRDVRLRSYQTLGLCAGAALAILFI